MADLRCSKCSSYLFTSPVQCSCGDRLCDDCYNSSKKTLLNCPKSSEEISLDACFKDKAAENEVKAATIKCTNQDCPWEGPGKFCMEHIASCKFKKIPCPNKQYGCTKLLLQSQWEEHLERECRFIPVQCPWCSKKVHNKVKHVTAGPLLAPNKPGETRVEHVQCEMEPQRVAQSPNEDHQPQTAIVSLCPIPISESVTGPGAGLLIKFWNCR